jgi:hypothetical protein
VEQEKTHKNTKAHASNKQNNTQAQNKTKTKRNKNRRRLEWVDNSFWVANQKKNNEKHKNEYCTPSSFLVLEFSVI